jgi:cytochrome c oxidase cbb3-type subunit 3
MKLRPSGRIPLAVGGLLSTLLLLGASASSPAPDASRVPDGAGPTDTSWTAKVPDSDRTRVNPMAGQPEAIAAGARLYRNDCAQCHGKDGSGRGRRPSLRSREVTAATDGELAWLLQNGSPWKGMPSWAKLPQPQRWQIIAYLRTLPPQAQTP